MIHSHVRGRTASLLVALVATAACTSPRQLVAQAAPATDSPGQRAAMARARADSARYPYTAADVHFMSAMIGHHAQAIVMAGWAPSHGASASVRTLAERIINAQRDEIATMQRWLRDRGQPVPAAEPMAMPMSGMASMSMHDDSTHAMHMADMTHMAHDSAHAPMLMPGMLTPAEMHRLDQARGPEFDRLFLSSMIHHHQGAVSMVKALFGSYGAAQDEAVFKFATDVNVDQTTEIARMQRMLAALLFQDDAP